LRIFFGLAIAILLVSLPLYPVFSLEDDVLNKSLLDKNTLGQGTETQLVVDRASEVKQSNREIDPEDWGIYNGCISSNRIQNIKVLDTNSAMLKLVDGKEVKMHFMGRCEGIRQYGFVYTARNNLFCIHKNSVRVLHTGQHCQVDSLIPYLGGEEVLSGEKQ
jgi:hypothetical protein